MNISQRTTGVPLLSKLYTVSIILSTSLFMYNSGIPSVRLAELILILLSVTIIVKHRFTVNRKFSMLLVFVAFDVFLSIISLTSQGVFDFSIYIRLVRFCMYVFFVLASKNVLNRDYFLKVLRLISIIVSIYVILQLIMFYVFHVVLPNQILPIPTAKDSNLDKVMESAGSNYFRAYGIFTEPSAVAKFLLPGFALSLFGWDDSRKADILSLVVISTAILITTSLQGIIVASVILIYYLFAREKPNKMIHAKRQKKIAFIIVILSIVVAALYSAGILDGVIARFDNILPNTVRPGSSNALRLYRGYAVFGEIPWIYKLIGIGHGNIGEFVISNGITTRFDGPLSKMAYAEYTNGISAILLCSGIIGFIAFAYFAISLYKKVSMKYRAILLIFILLELSGGGIFGIVMVYYYSIIYLGIENKSDVNNDYVLQ